MWSKILYFYGQATFKLIDKLADNEGSLSTEQFEDLSSTLDIMLE